MAKSTRKLVFVGISLLWVALTSAGLGFLWDYAHRPGTTGGVSSAWPADLSKDVLAPGKPTLLLFLHPECGCSRATLTELERVAVRVDRPFAIRIYFNDSEILPRPLKESSLWAAAERVPGALLCADRDGRITRAFGAETSGTVLFFDHDGRLLFKGGVTGARGHEGENPNEDALLAALQASPPRPVEASVYGCAIF